MTVSKDIFGRTDDNTQVERFTLENAAGVRAQLMTYGACLCSVRTPDRNGTPAEITLNFSSFARYLQKHPFFGMTVGRVANRTQGARFTLDGKTYALAKTDGENHLHGGTRGFDKHVWSAEAFGNPADAGVRFTRVSPAGEEGYPGTLKVAVTFTLNEQNELVIDYEAESDKPTPVNLTNHAYWNLNGRGTGSILDHVLTVKADRYVQVDGEAIPLGELPAVDGPMDFRTPKPIGRDIAGTAKGYDHAYEVGPGGTVAGGTVAGGTSGADPAGGRGTAAGGRSGRGRNGDQPVDLTGELRHVAALVHPGTGRKLETLTTMPAVQVYTSNMLEGVTGTDGRVFHKHDAVCLETEYFPDAVNQPAFFSPVLRPGATYNHRTIYRFSVVS